MYNNFVINYLALLTTLGSFGTLVTTSSQLLNCNYLF